MDYDNDGVLDMISGSYDPGDIYLFRGLGEGQYAGAKSIVDKNGLELVHHPIEYAKWKRLHKGGGDLIELRVASFGSWPTMVDWDSDGDLDMLIGSFEGNLFLRLNDGNRNCPEFQGSAIKVQVEGKPLHVNGHAAPVIADWDGDDRWDLVVGSSDGAVGWFRNTGTLKQPRFDRYRQLVSPASDSKFLEQSIKHGESPKLGTRAQICVEDYNNDGMLDLILGDYSDSSWLRDLTDAEKRSLSDLERKRQLLYATAMKLRKQFAQDTNNPQFQEEMEELGDVMERLDKKHNSFFKERRNASFVWLFLRRHIQDPESSEPSHLDEMLDSRASNSDTGINDKTDQLSMLLSISDINPEAGLFELNVDLTIKEGWHLYASVPEGSPHQITTLKSDFPEEVTAVGPWIRPNGLPSGNQPDERVYTHKVRFSRLIEYKGDQSTEVSVIVEYEVCDHDHCLPPSRLKQTVSVPPTHQ